MITESKKQAAKRLTLLRQKRKLPKVLQEMAAHGYTLEKPPRYSSPAYAAYQSARSLTRQFATAEGRPVPDNCKLRGKPEKQIRRRNSVQRTTKSNVEWLPRDEWERQTKIFYSSQAWKELRYEILREGAGTCSCCGARASDGVRIHVDHIKPRSKYPELQLEKSNMQILCEDCNFGKSNYYNDDWRVKMENQL